MHAKVKITLLFTTIMLVLLFALCSYIYYSFYTLRISSVRAQLADQATIAAHLFNESGRNADSFIKRSDGLSWQPIEDKTIKVFGPGHKKIFSRESEKVGDITVSREQMQQADLSGVLFFTHNKRDVIVRNNNKDSLLVVVGAYDVSGLKNLQRVGLILWLCFLTGIFISFISGYFFSRILLKPVKRIADEVNHISAQNLEQRIQTGKSKDEWNYLANTLNELLDRLQESFQIQSRFISAASHELSTPLTAVSSQIEIALQKERSGAEYKEVMQSAYQSVQQLIRLTQTLLQFASISGNAGGVELDSVRMDEVLMRLPGDIARINPGFSVKLNFKDLPPDEADLLVFGNEELLFSALKNIVFNSCKYSDDGTATVTLTFDQEMIIIAVQDNGKGIPQEELEHIFQPFYRTSDSKSIAGFGMGLPLVKRIIKLHKGKINVQSVVGLGTIFSVQLPVAASAAPAGPG